MKIPLSIKECYFKDIELYKTLKEQVDSYLLGIKESKWHYESRLKALESFALKFETGRFNSTSIFDDFFGGMIVVPSYKEISKVEKILRDKFILHSKKPSSSSFASYAPENFVFDDLRLYLKFDEEKFLSPRAEGLNNLVFEVQIKTFLQHAWSLSTHDLVYKSENISWSKHRVAYQVKAMLENIELSISSADELSNSELINKENKLFKALSKIVKILNKYWVVESLPFDMKRLAENINFCFMKLGLNANELDPLIESTSCHTIKNISPYQSILYALIESKWDLFTEANNENLSFLFSEELKELIDETKVIFLKDNRYLITV